MIWNFIIENKVWFVGVISSIATYFTSKKVRKNQECAGELQNLKTLREVEKELIDDMKANIEEYQKIVDNLKMIIAKQKETIKKLKKEIGILKTKQS